MRRVREIREDLTAVTFAWQRLSENIREAYDRREWEKLGWRSWKEYITAEFDPSLLPRASKEVLAQIVTKLAAEGGMSTRAIGDALGISQSTATRMARSTESSDSVDQRRTGLDGKSRPAHRVQPTPSSAAEMRASIHRLDHALAIAKGRTGLKEPAVPVSPALKEPVDAGIIRPDTDIIKPEPIEPGTVPAEPAKPDSPYGDDSHASSRKWVADQLKTKAQVSTLLNRTISRLAWLDELGLATRAAERYDRRQGEGARITPEMVKSAIAALGDILAVLDARDDDQ